MLLAISRRLLTNNSTKREAERTKETKAIESENPILQKSSTDVHHRRHHQLQQKEKFLFMKMGLHKSYCTTITLSLLLLLSTSINHITNARTFIYADCSPSKTDPTNTPFLTAVNTLLSSFISTSSSTSYNSSSTTTPSPLYGLYQCRSDLPLPTCTTCVHSAVDQLTLLCASSLSAALQLDGCLVRYSTDDFLGVPDTTLVYKRCSPGTSNDGEFFRRRDDVMADLLAGVGFRVSSSGTVQGYIQCLGDLNANDCSQCVTSAVGRLKDACGGALSADVYLGQCYARYWASGYYPSKDDSVNSEDDVGKTVAIIVGILAGLALIVVFLSFLRKAFG